MRASLRAGLALALVLTVSGARPAGAQVQVVDDFQAGLFQTGMEISHTLNRGYVASRFVGQVTVVDLETNEALRTLNARGGTIISLSPDEELLVATAQNREHFVYRTSDNSLAATVQAGTFSDFGAGLGWSADGAFLYILRVPTSPTVPSTLHEISTETFLETRVLEIPDVPIFGPPFFLAVSPGAPYAIVPQTFQDPDAVAIIDLEQMEILASLNTGAGPADVAFSENGRRAYLSGRGPNRVSVIDLPQAIEIDRFDTDASAGALSFDAATSRLAVRCTDLIQVLDVETGDSIVSIPIPDVVEVALVPYTGFAVATVYETDTLHVADVDPTSVTFGTVVQVLTLPGCVGTCDPLDVVLHPNGQRAYVLSDNLLRVDVLDLPSPPLTIELIPEGFSFPAGGRVRFEAILTNHTNAPIDLTGWIDVFKPNGNPFGANPVLGPRTRTLGPGQSISKSASHPIGAGVPPSGPYRTVGLVGSFPDGAVSTSGFRYFVTDP